MPEVPSELLGGFLSVLPDQEELADLPSFDWGGHLMSNTAKWTQYAVARGIEGQSLVPTDDAYELMDLTISFAAGVKTWENASAGQKLDLLASGYLATMQTLMRVGGLASAVPVIGLVAQVGLSLQRSFWKGWYEKVRFKGCTAARLHYVKSADERWQREALAEIETGSLTRVFMPPIIGDVGFKSEKVQSFRKKNLCQRKVTFLGDRAGMGALPGGFGICRAVESEGAWWSDYHPGAMAASQVAWAMAQANPHMLDVPLLKEAWAVWYMHIANQYIEWAEEGASSVGALAHLITPWNQDLDKDSPTYGHYSPSRGLPAETCLLMHPVKASCKPVKMGHMVQGALDSVGAPARAPTGDGLRITVVPGLVGQPPGDDVAGALILALLGWGIFG